MKFKNHKQKLNHILALVCFIIGGLLPLAFAPLHYYWLAYLIPAFLILILDQTDIKRALWLGFMFGLGYYGVGVSWVYISIHVYGYTAIPLAAFFTLCFVAFLSVISFMPMAGLYRLLFPRPTLLAYLIAFPALWILGEWFRGWILTGFPWNYLAYSQVASPLQGFVPIFGAYGTGFITLFIAANVAIIFKNIYHLIAGNKIQNKKIGLIAASLISIVIILSLGVYLSKIDWTTPYQKPLRVSLVQGDIPQDQKWLSEEAIPSIQRYLDLTKPYWNSDLIVWGEAAIPIPLPMSQNIIDELDDQAFQNKAALITGILIQVPGHMQYYNGVIALGEGQGEYYKRHLVPFGEYVPFGKYLRGIIAFFAIPMSDMRAGPDDQQDLTVKGIKVAPFLCYEIAYDDNLQRELPEAQLMVTLSNDTWFGDSLAPPQHLQIGQFRALQAGRPLLFVTNNGITAIIDPHGNIIKSSPQFTQTVLTGDVQPYSGQTPWFSIGNVWIICSLIAILLLAVLIRYFRCSKFPKKKS